MVSKPELIFDIFPKKVIINVPQKTIFAHVFLYHGIDGGGFLGGLPFLAIIQSK